MSLFNGNGMKATGRSSSQRSIHDYPEHLNPFYEDENHKRLRFWKIGMDEKKSGRSNSTFSINGLKGLWSFKSFKLKKKSSTLGINKTSESPTFSRRDDDYYGSQSNVGHTVSVGLESNFQRGAGYRCSLQDLNSNSRPSENVFFVRNHRYRSTAQPSSSSGGRYQNDATVTPTPRSRFSQSNLSRGSSQISVNSGNPFEDDYLDTMSQISSPERGSIRRSGRKKRRAPQPPVSPAQMSNKTIATVEETSGEGDKIVNISNLTAEIESFVQAADTDKENIESTNALHSDLRIDEDETRSNEINRENVRDSSRQSPESNDYYPQDEQNEVITLEKIQNLGSMDIDVSNNSERCKKSPVKIIIRAPTEEEPIAEEVTEINQSIEIIHETEGSEKETPHIQKEQTIETIEDHKEETMNQPVVQAESVSEVEVSAEIVNDKRADAEHVELRSVEPTKEIIVTKEDDCSNAERLIDTQGDDYTNTTPTSAAVEFILENDAPNETITSLRITESTDDLPSATDSKSAKENTQKEEKEKEEKDEEIVQIRPKPSVETDIEETKEFEKSSQTELNLKLFQNCDIRTVPLKLDSPKPNKRNNSDGDVIEKEKPVPPQRRRSVKEIIDSINKCQSLLKINQKGNGVEKEKVRATQASSSSFSVTTSSSSKLMNSKNTFANRNLNDSNEKQYQDKKMFNDVAEVNNNGKRVVDDLIPTVVEEFDEINNNEIHNHNGIVFEKCVVRNDQKLNEKKKSNVEWNPVPKPRRHRHSQQGSFN